MTMAGSERNPLLLNRRSGDDAEEKRSRSLAATVALSAAMLVQSFLLVGVFPYSGFMAMQLVPSLTEETVGSYAGMIASSFMVGRTASSFFWGRMSDKYGRVFVIRTSLLLSAAFSIFFGLSLNYYMALVWRFFLGLSNGIMGPIKVLVSEYNKGDKNKETEMMGIVIGMWGLGFLINPAITGYLSNPVKQFPDSYLVQVCEPLLAVFPFILPNVAACLVCLVADSLVHKFVEETLPPETRQSFTIFPCKNKIRRAVDSEAVEPVSTETDTLLPKDSDAKQNEELSTEPATMSSLWTRKTTRDHLVVYWLHSFLVVGLEELFPLFCLSKASGLAIEEKLIGKIFSGSGLFYIVISYFFLTELVRKLGFYKTMTIGSSLSVPFCVLIPLSLVTNQGVPEGTLARSSLLLLSSVYALVQTFSVTVVSAITMATNRTVPPQHRGSTQGLAMFGGSIAKAAAPAFSGILFSSIVGFCIPPTGSVVVFGLFSFLGICLAVKVSRLKESESPVGASMA